MKLKNKYKIIEFKFSEDCRNLYKLKIKRWWFPIWIQTEYIYETYAAAIDELKWLQRIPSSKVVKNGYI